MKCPNCDNFIPDDSRFCPYCGKSAIDYDEIRSRAKEITVKYSMGYNFFVRNGMLPRFVYNSKLENCNKIIEYKELIINKNQELQLKKSLQQQEQNQVTQEYIERKKLQKTEEERDKKIRDEKMARMLDNYNNYERDRRAQKLEERVQDVKAECHKEYFTGYGCGLAFLGGFLCFIIGGVSKSVIAVICGLLIDFILTSIFSNSKETNIKEWKKEHPDDPVNKYL